MQSVLESLVVASVLLWSCYVVLRRFLPNTSFKWQQELANWLAHQQFSMLSRWLMPKMQSGCASGCSGCSANKPACDTPTQLESEEKPVRWQT